MYIQPKKTKTTGPPNMHLPNGVKVEVVEDRYDLGNNLPKCFFNNDVPSLETFYDVLDHGQYIDNQFSKYSKTNNWAFDLRDIIKCKDGTTFLGPKLRCLRETKGSWQCYFCETYTEVSSMLAFAHCDDQYICKSCVYPYSKQCIKRFRECREEMNI